MIQVCVMYQILRGDAADVQQMMRPLLQAHQAISGKLRHQLCTSKNCCVAAQQHGAPPAYLSAWQPGPLPHIAISTGARYSNSLIPLAAQQPEDLAAA